MEYGYQGNHVKKCAKHIYLTGDSQMCAYYVEFDFNFWNRDISEMIIRKKKLLKQFLQIIPWSTTSANVKDRW